MISVVLDTNVVASGFFFSGPPARILDAWVDGRFTWVVSPEVFEEYSRTLLRLSARFGGPDPARFLSRLAYRAAWCHPVVSAPAGCADPDDDKFLHCAAAGGAFIVVSGDRALLRMFGWQDLPVVTPRDFVDIVLSD